MWKEAGWEIQTTQKGALIGLVLIKHVLFPGRKKRLIQLQPSLSLLLRPRKEDDSRKLDGKYRPHRKEL
jgi:hypothetical protein